MLRDSMEKSAFIILFCTGFGFLELCSGLPTDLSSVGTGKLNAVWVTSSLLLAVGFLIGIVSLIIGCICCRNGRGFKQNEAKAEEEFSNSNGCLSSIATDGFVNPSSSSEITIFPPYGVTSNVSSRSSVVHFEPLPNIKPQPPNLRPAAFSYSEQEISSQDWFYDPYNNFPRNQLKYLQEYGKGWFGRVVEGEAQNIVSSEKLTKVIVKMLHEDATPTDQMFFLHEVKFYRDLKHPNILNLLGRCLETEPFLILLESCPNGDLKSFLTQNMASAQALVEQGITLRMCCNITSGLQYMHENKFIHTDLAARNCLVTPDLTVKIGDYGNSIEIFKSDYYCAGSVALPVRWCAPETLKCTDVTIETREVTPVANVWTLAVVIWEICEFCKLPYEELNDDEVIVRVLGEKNYFLQMPKMLCLYKDELYHLMKLCWSQPLQRPTASQIGIILGNLLSSNKVMDKKDLDPKRFSQDFEQRWQKSKPNSIPKKDDAVEAADGFHCTNTIMFKGAKVADSSYIDSPLVVFMSHKNKLQDSPRLRLKAEKMKDIKNNIESYVSDSDNLDNKSSNCETEEEYFNGLKKSDSVKNLTGSLDRLNIVAQELQDKGFKGDFDFRSEVKPFEIVNSDYKAANAEIDSWLKGVEVNNEEDETFVRKISEAIRDLDAALAMEKTSSSEENSGKSSHQNSPGKETKDHEEPVVVDFKLGGDTSTSFINFIPKSFELSSLQNSEEPQSLNFNNSISVEKRNYFPNSSVFESLQGHSSIASDPRNSLKLKNNLFDESLKGNESLLNVQSRNSSDTEDEIWRRRIEKGEFSEKVKEKSKSIANLMILTHIEASDDSDIDLDRSFDRSLNRNSYNRRHYSNPKSSLSSNNCGSENDLTNAVLNDNFEESLRKLSNDHKEYGHFDSLGMILPAAVDRENLWGTIISKSNSDENLFSAMNSLTAVKGNSKTVDKSYCIADPSEMVHRNDAREEKLDNHNNFLGNTASEKLDNVIMNEKCSRISASLIKSTSDTSDDMSSVFLSEVKHGLGCANNKIGNDYKKKISNSSSQMNDSNKSIEVEEHGIKKGLVKGISLNETMHSEYLQFSDNESHDSVLAYDSYELKDKQNSLEGTFSENDDKLKAEERSLRESTVHVDINENRNDRNISENLFTVSEVPTQENALGGRRKEKMEIININCEFKSPDLKNSHHPSELSENNVNDGNLEQIARYKEIPEIKITEAKNLVLVEDESDQIEIVVPKVRPFRFVIKEDLDCLRTNCKLPNENNDFEKHQKLEDITSDSQKNHAEMKNISDLSFTEIKSADAESVIVTTEGSASSESAEVLNEKVQNDNENAAAGNFHVIIGACEDYTLDYFKGLKTNFGKEENENENITNGKFFKDISEVTINKDLNLEIWDKHLEKSITQKIDNTNFDDINFNFFNVSLESSEKGVQSDTHTITSDNSISTSPSTSLSNVEAEENSMKEKKNEDHLQSNGFTNLNENNSEEEYDNNKLRTPDDERSSDSGFRDKGSLSESVEDACEGKYNLEDIEAELEEAYAIGSFNGCEMEKEKDLSNISQSNKNFECDDTKFYEDENKIEEDLSDVDGEIEFWQNQEDSDYYREISEFNPIDSRGWYLHPPDENFYFSNAAVDEEFVNALRNELRQKLPKQSRSFHEFSEDSGNFGSESSEDDKSGRYLGNFSAALSPILEEQDHAPVETVKSEISENVSHNLSENAGQKCKKTAVNLMETGKFVDTNAFMHYLDYMVETEGKNKQNVVSCQVGDNETNGIAEEVTIEELPQSDCNDMLSEVQAEEDAKSFSFESDSLLDDIMIVDTDTNEITFLKPGEAPPDEKKNENDVYFEMVGEDEDLTFSPDSNSPERDRSLSDPSRSSNGSQAEDMPSETTFSSPDMLSECYLTPTSEKSPFDSPPHSNSNTSQDDESEIKIMKMERKLSTDFDDSRQVGELPRHRESVLPPEEAPTRNEGKQYGNEGWSEGEFLPDGHFDGGECCSGMDELHEMSTSFMGDNASDDGDVEHVSAADTKDHSNSAFAKEKSPLRSADGVVNEWESFSSGGEDEMSSSSGEFIWKDGDKESKVKVKHVSDGGGDKEFFQDPDSEHVSECGRPLESELGSQIEDFKATNELGKNCGDDCYDNENIEFGDGTELTDSDDDRDGSSTGSSASITDFVPSAWNSQAMPSRPALRSPDKKSENQKRNVWFKKQKYHCVYEYPREPSDSESANNSPQKHFTYEIDTSEVSNKYFPYGSNNKMNLKNKYFTYGVPDLIGYSSYVDWDPVEGNDGDIVTENDTADDCSLKEVKKTFVYNDNNYYNLNSLDYDFNSSSQNNEDEFFISSSARPFQGSSLSQFFPSNSGRFSMFKVIQEPDDFKTESTEVLNICRSQDFITPDSGVEDSTNATPIKKTDGNNVKSEVHSFNESQKDLVNILEDLKFNFDNKLGNSTISEELALNDSSSSNTLSIPSSNSPATSVSPAGLGELRHARDKLKLNLPMNHNIDLDVTPGKNAGKIDEAAQMEK